MNIHVLEAAIASDEAVWTVTGKDGYIALSGAETLHLLAGVLDAPRAYQFPPDSGHSASQRMDKIMGAERGGNVCGEHCKNGWHCNCEWCHGGRREP